jgi:hypothetical protein
MEKNKFTLDDFLEMHKAIVQLKECTVASNSFLDPIIVDLAWHNLDTLLIKMGNHFKDQLVDKEAVEKLTGKTIQSMEKVYDEQGMLTGVNVIPIPAAHFIEMKFTITPEGAQFE